MSKCLHKKLAIKAPQKVLQLRICYATIMLYNLREFGSNILKLDEEERQLTGICLP